MSLQPFNLEDLAQFLVRAKKLTYAGEGAEVPPNQIQTPGFKELSFHDGDWEYRDSYAGYFFAPGREVVWFQRKPIWMMAYSGGMAREHRTNRAFAKQTFTFLKSALSQVSVERPFRGPASFTQGDYIYSDTLIMGNICDFLGTEFITHQGKEVFRQHYIGGLILPKS